MLDFLAAVLGSALDPAIVVLMGLAAAFAYRSEIILLVAIAVAALGALMASATEAQIWPMFPPRLLGALAVGFLLREVFRWLRRTGKSDLEAD